MNEDDGDGVHPFDGRLECDETEQRVLLGLLVLLDRRLDGRIERLLRDRLGHIVVGIFEHVSLHYCHTVSLITEAMVGERGLHHSHCLHMIHLD